MKLEDCIAFITNKVSKELSQTLNKRLIECGITRAQWVALYYIQRNENINQQELSRLVDARPSTVNGILNRLETDGLIKRKVDKKNKRQNILHITQKGKELNKIYTQVAEEFRDDCVKNLSQSEINTFTSVLEKMVKALSDSELERKKDDVLI